MTQGAYPLENGLSWKLKLSDVGILLVVWNFVVHMVVGTLLFIMVAGLALALTYWAGLMERFGFSGLVIDAIGAMKYIILVIDLVLFIFFLVQVSFDAFTKLRSRLAE